MATPTLRALLAGALSIGKEMGRMVLRHPVLGILAVPLDDEGRIVMMRRRDTGTWCLPGGSVEWGETLESALRREVAEETGHRLVAIRRLVGIYSDPARDPRMHAITVVVEARVAPPPPDAPALNPLEVIEVHAFHADQLPGALAFDTRRLLDDHFRAGPPIID